MSRREFQKPRDIRFVDAIRINWRHAMDEAEDFMAKKMLNPSLDERLEGVAVFNEVKRLYGNDDTDGYLDYLDKNRAILKTV